ncbi:unnamed protein product [Caenorhabditis auriculariae]|uniref:Serpentine receptor class gamma n=1 Tax=Caenorhabditis auriculariae TaxID=2777116 RepID=A0A8S1GSU2_9PELO|nr:unnamed protein product [Caenorhabditis auriculariae]
MLALSVALTVEYISTFVSLICLPINVAFVYLIFVERHRAPYNTPFFRLCIHLCIADILMEAFSTIFFKLPTFGLFPKTFYKENWSVVPIAGMNYLGHAQAIGIIFIAINRLVIPRQLVTISSLFGATVAFSALRFDGLGGPPCVRL